MHASSPPLGLQARAVGRNVYPALRLQAHGLVGPSFVRAHVMSVVEDPFVGKVTGTAYEWKTACSSRSGKDVSTQRVNRAWLDRRSPAYRAVSAELGREAVDLLYLA